MTHIRHALAGLLVLAVPATLPAQDRIVEARVTGEYRMQPGDTPESGGRIARADALTKGVTWAVGQLEGRPDVRALRLSPSELYAYAAALVDITEPPASGGQASAPASVQVLARLDVAEAARHMIGFRRDEWVHDELIAAGAEIQRLEQALRDRTAPRSAAPATDAPARGNDDPETLLTALSVKHIALRAYAAMTRTQPATTGGRTTPPDGLRRAQELAGAALAIAPESPDARYLAGDLLVETDQAAAAEAEYRKALAAGPPSGAGRTKLAAALRYQGKLTESMAELREALSLDPTYPRAHSDLGTLLSAQGNFADAIAAYREAIRLNPDSADAHNGLGVALARTGKLEEAVAEFREIVRIDPDSTIGYYNLAYALADLDRDVEAAAALREVVRIYPDHYNARYNLAELFRLEGKYDDSATQFREYVRLAPDTPQNRRNIARAQRFIRQFEDPNTPVVEETMRPRPRQ